MGLRFVFGPSGAGKSRFIYEEMLARAAKKPKQNFLIIVPDQFTMQTQKDLVSLSEQGGILNIDVLSFGRLGHRILEEVGRPDTPVLDDTGKSLVLQKIASGKKDELPAIGSFIQKQGYIHEVKSAISEFMQYGIGPEDVGKLIEFSKKRGALVSKLTDLQTLYRDFLDYINGQFITTEETLGVLEKSLCKSRVLQGSIVVFDGFTGFTPIQYRVIQELMRLCDEVVMVLTVGEEEDPYKVDGEQKLFYLSKKTVADLERLANEVSVSRSKDSFITAGYRFADAAALKHLEQNLFRYRGKSYQGEQNEIRIFEAQSPREEVHQTGLFIKELIRKEGLAFRDIAVIMGNLDGYVSYVETEFEKMEIPCFIDQTRQIGLNPMIEYIKSGLVLFLQDFSYEAVFHFLRSGLADFTMEEVDQLENYCLQTGIRGWKAYRQLFTRQIMQGEEGQEHLEQMNELRERLVHQVEMLAVPQKESVETFVNALYQFLTENQVQEKLVQWENRFAQQLDAPREREYAQIYRLVMELLEQIYDLLKDEQISRKEFLEILEAGFGEIEVGTIPQNVDRVLVGDMERTRLKQVKVLFFLGVNDGNIPKNASKGGIISDMDREFLRESGQELAPSPRQQMFIQRLYLYLNMTKPSQKLFLSYARMDNSGKAIRQAYLIDVVKSLFPGLKTEIPALRSPLEQIVTKREGIGYLAEGLRQYVTGVLTKEQEKEVQILYHAYGKEDRIETRNLLQEAAFKRYEESGLSAVIARALYGTYLENSVSRLETYASCAYRHFLQYGLSLKEREEFAFGSADLGNIYHGVLEVFAKRLTEAGFTWFDFTEEFAQEAVRKAVEEFAASYGNSILYSNHRNEYVITRMGRILTRTVLTLQRQLKKGSFHPDAYELSFKFTDQLESVNIHLSEKEKMRLEGRIDRIDIAEDEDHVFVKVIDYKSGNKHFDLAALYYGLQLQLVVYLNAAMEVERKKHPDKEVLPAALLYYHIDDPVIETAVELTDEEMESMIAGQLCTKGIVSSEPGIVERLDGELEGKSEVIPVELKKDGSLSARSCVLSGEDLNTVSHYVSRKIVEIGREILDGKIDLNPYEKGQEQACTYCVYRKVCGFELSMPGCERRQLKDLAAQEILERMQE